MFMAEKSVAELKTIAAGNQLPSARPGNDFTGAVFNFLTTLPP
jgi:hypothetical protein